MNNIVTLTKVLIKNNSIGGNKKGKKKDKGAYIYIFVLAIYVLLFSAPIMMVLDEILATYNFGELILSLVLPVGGIASIIFAIFSMASMFYYSNDIEQLVPYPVKSGELFIAKFLSSLTSIYLILFMFVFPIIFGVGLGVDAGITYYLYAAMICVLMPILPAAIVSIVFLLLNKVLNLGKRKTLFMYITVALVMIFSLSYGLGMGYLLEMETGDLVNLLSGQHTSIIEASNYIFPFFNSAKYALMHNAEVIGIASFMTFLGFNILAMIILYFLGEKFYLKGLTKNSGTKKEKKSLEKIYSKDSGGIMKALIKKEWKIIKRTPVYMLNIVVLNLIFPILFVITYLIAPEEEIIGNIDFENSGVYLIVVALIVFMCEFCGSTGSSSAISREGKNATFMKTIPVSLKKQIDAKVYFSFALDLIVVAITEVCAIFMFKIPYIYLLLVNLPLVFIVLVSNYINVLLDLKRPKISWNDESEAVKQNMTVLIAMMMSMLLAAILAVFGILLLNTNVNIYLTSFVFTIVAILCYILVVIYIKKKETKLFDKVM